jgi:hypothetical protein
MPRPITGHIEREMQYAHPSGELECVLVAFTFKFTPRERCYIDSASLRPLDGPEWELLVVKRRLHADKRMEVWMNLLPGEWLHEWAMAMWATFDEQTFLDFME